MTEVTIDPNPVPAAIPNSIEFYVKSAKRGGTPYIVDSANVFGDASVAVGDGFVNLAGPIFPFEVNEWPIEPGLMKLTVEGDWTNNGSVGVTVTIRKFDNKPEVEAEEREILQGDFTLIPLDIPDGTTEAVFELSWEHNWAEFPTNDLDMFLFGPGFIFFPDFSGGATLNSPEQIVVSNPTVGIWHVVVLGFDVFTGEGEFFLDVRLTPPAEDEDDGDQGDDG